MTDYGFYRWSFSQFLFYTIVLNTFILALMINVCWIYEPFASLVASVAECRLWKLTCHFFDLAKYVGNSVAIEWVGRKGIYADNPMFTGGRCDWNLWTKLIFFVDFTFGDTLNLGGMYAVYFVFWSGFLLPKFSSYSEDILHIFWWLRTASVNISNDSAKIGFQFAF